MTAERNRKHKKSEKRRELTAASGIRIVVGSMLRTVILLGLLCAALGAVIGAVKFGPVYEQFSREAKKTVEESTLDTFRLQEASYIYDANGDVLAKLFGDEDSSYLSYEDIPEDAVNAFIAIEDRTFWTNPGIDPKGIFRVMVHYLRSEGEEMHGASTITQQLARNRFLTREVSITRKVKEMLISLNLTKKYSKQQIMEFYINDINYANYYYGLEAAARGYFNRDASELSLSQIAYICAIPNSPTYYNPYTHPEHAIARRNKILDDMLSMGTISQEAHDAAIAEEIVVERQKVPLHNYETTYAVDCAVRYLMRMNGFTFRYGFRDKADYEAYDKQYNEAYDAERDALYTGGYSLYTSIDPRRQEELQDAVDSTLEFSDEVSDGGIFALQGAATAVDNDTGKVVAIVGGRSQDTSTYTLNRAFQSFRQPGSSIKPLIVYTPALENGWRSDSTVTDIDVTAAKEKGANVRTMGGDTMALRRAVELSKNGVAWSIYDSLTPALGLSYLTQMRFDRIGPGDYYNATALGGFTHGVTAEEMAGAYAALANHGSYREPTCIVKMIDTAGNDIFQDNGAIQVYQKESADMMIDILKGVVTRGTAAAMGWDNTVEAAGKTGTTNGSKDGWFCGVTPYYTLTVWVGFDQPRQLSSLYGATYPASVWKKAMKKLVAGEEPAKFPEATKDSGAGSGVYLAGYSDADHVINGKYTVRKFRSDHEIADRILTYIDRMNDGDSDMSRGELQDMAENISFASMKQRMKDIIDHDAPGEEHHYQAPESLDNGEAPTEADDGDGGAEPQGPAEDSNNVEVPVGPGAEMVDEPVGPGLEN